jgi:hypothetical protein
LNGEASCTSSSVAISSSACTGSIAPVCPAPPVVVE